MIGKLLAVALLFGLAVVAGELTKGGGHRTAAAPAVACHPAPAFAAAAQQNATTMRAAAWSVFHRAEMGWEIYAPLAAHEIGVDCVGDSEGFAAALAAWQNGHRLPSTGMMDPATLQALDQVWQGRRPFVAASAHGACPTPPAALALAATEEGYGGKPIQLRAGALAAYRRMVAAARAETPALAANRRLLTIFSGYRDPAADAARCATEHNCGTAARATCSAHRTGLAMDLFLGAAPGFPPDSSADPNRLYLSRSTAYLWMVRRAADFGFVNYPFEPWHWEWTGEAP
jgi:zinc D-Ala-D-Ala carboxypeptidase